MIVELPGGFNPPEEPSLLNRLIASTIRRFWQTEAFPYGDHIEPYTAYSAVTDAMEELTENPGDIFLAIARETLFAPNRLDLSDATDQEDWDSFFVRASKEILVEELEARHPETQEEQERRMEEYPKYL